MNRHQTDSTPDESIGLVAAEWLVKRDRGFTPAEQEEFLHWLACDPRHGEWLARHQETWRQFNLLSQWRPEPGAEPDPDLLARPARTRRRVAPLAWAAAACLLFGFLAVQFRRAETPPAVAPLAACERRVLADGSVVELNRGAALEVRFTPAERRVMLLAGEAYFTVEKNPARPFLVHAADVRVRAVGTAFNVRMTGGAVEVLVTEGRIEVTPPDFGRSPRVAGSPGGPPVLVAGQRTVVSLSAGADAGLRIVAASEQDMARLRAWRPRLLDFDSTPLSEVVAEFNRRNRVQLVIADPELGRLPIVASFRSDSIDAFVRLLEVTAGVRAEHRNENQIILRQASTGH